MQKVAQFGVPGQDAFVRELRGTTVSKANELFAALTKNAVSTSTQTNGTIVANMGNNNFIIFRTISGPNSPEVIATVEFNFIELLGTNSFKLKFYP